MPVATSATLRGLEVAQIEPLEYGKVDEELVEKTQKKTVAKDESNRNVKLLQDLGTYLREFKGMTFTDPQTGEKKTDSDCAEAAELLLEV